MVPWLSSLIVTGLDGPVVISDNSLFNQVASCLAKLSVKHKKFKKQDEVGF